MWSGCWFQKINVNRIRKIHAYAVVRISHYPNNCEACLTLHVLLRNICKMPVKPRKPPFATMIKHPMFVRGFGFGAALTATVVVYVNALGEKWRKSKTTQEEPPQHIEPLTGTVSGKFSYILL